MVTVQELRHLLAAEADQSLEHAGREVIAETDAGRRFVVARQFSHTTDGKYILRLIGNGTLRSRSKYSTKMS